MAAGGSWQTQNKVRPGAYINVVGVPKPLSQVGERGVVAVAMPLKWGPKIVELTASEFLSGAGLLKAGVQYTDENYTPSVSPSSVECSPGFALRLILQNASKVIIYRSNLTNSTTADNSNGDCSMSAKYPGSFGNRISVAFERQGTASNYTYVLKTFIDDVVRNVTKAKELGDLTGDELVDISWGDTDWSSSYENKITLSGGTDGSSLDTGWLSSAIAEFYTRSWNVFVCEPSSATEQSQIKSAIEDLRDNIGVKVQAVLYNHSGEDYEGIINIAGNTSYILTDGDVVRPSQTVYFVAGITAGASLTQSNSGAVVTDAVDLTGTGYPQTNEEIINALNSGLYVLSRRSDGAIVVEKDINSLHTFTPTKGYIFSKQRPLRVMDNVANDVKLIWNKSYLGKVSNNDDGRAVFKGDLISYFKQLESIGAIQNFDGETDVKVIAGNEIDSVVVSVWIQPVDSMEKLYMTVNVEG